MMKYEIGPCLFVYCSWSLGGGISNVNLTWLNTSFKSL